MGENTSIGDATCRAGSLNTCFLPRQSQAGEHHAALPYRDPCFVTASRGGSVARARGFAILTAARTSEVLGATWSTIDLDAPLDNTGRTNEGSRNMHSAGTVPSNHQKHDGLGNRNSLFYDDISNSF